MGVCWPLKHWLVLAVGALLVSGSVLAGEPDTKNLDMNGIALFEELGVAQFLGAFFTDHPGAPAITQLVTSRDMRMELKVVNAKGFSKRRLDQMWLEGLTINNSAELLAAKSKAIGNFIAMVKGNLAQGDHLVVEAKGERELLVWLNGVALGSIHDDQLFRMLLSCWIGRVPLSSEFRAGLLSFPQINSGLSSRYLALQPQPGREPLVKAWRQLGAQKFSDSLGLAQQ